MLLRFRCWAAVAAVLLVARFASAQGPLPSPILPSTTSPSPAPDASPAVSTTPAPELSRADLEPFLDALLTSQIENRDIAGAVISVVKDGEVLLSKGYGFADFAARKPVVADETLFRPGSISKLFTATAVMQLVEQGKLDLDQDIREYLDFEIVRSFPEPITMRNILTHTAGFEESLKSLFGAPEVPPPPLRDYLIANMPAQIFRPGTVPAYSNYAVSLAGYIVERLTNQPLDQYLLDHVFGPLHMSSSTFTQPLPPAWMPRMSNGYTTPARGPKPFEICSPAPAGALTTTATDMTRFMLALLNGGTLDGATILQPDTLSAMQSRQYELHPDLHAMGLGFIDYSENGHTIWGHGGDTLLFHSDLFLIPDAGVGVFVSYNSGGSRPGSGRGELLHGFLRRYFPETDISPSPALSDTAAHGREVSGVYEASRKSQTNPFHIMSVVGQIAVNADREGILTIENARNLRGQSKRWREVGPYVYDEIDGPDRVAFRRDQNGVVTDLLPNTPISVGQRVPTWQSKSLLLPLVGGSLGFILLTLALWPVAAILRKRYRFALLRDWRSRRWFLCSRIACLFIVGMLVAFVYPLSRIENDISWLGDRINPWLRASQICGWLACAGLVVLLVTAARLWKKRGIGWWARTHATLLFLAAATFLFFAWQWHMLSPSLKF